MYRVTDITVHTVIIECGKGISIAEVSVDYCECIYMDNYVYICPLKPDKITIFYCQFVGHNYEKEIWCLNKLGRVI